MTREDPAAALLELGLEPVGRAAGVRESTRLGRATCRAWSARASMGTVVSVVALHRSAARAEEAAEAAFVEMERLVSLLSRHDTSTPLAQLNAAGRLADAPEELLAVVARARRFHVLTRGAFDVTVKPLLDLLGATHGAPSRAELREAAELVGAEKLRRSGRRLFFDRSGMGLTLDGIAKGYIVDRMADALGRHGVRRFLINAGGDVRAAGGRQDGRPWTIGVRDPQDPHRFCDVVPLADGALASSGNYEKAFAHIVDAAAGRPARAKLGVSVRAPEALAADALATALFVMGAGAGRRLVRSLPGCACLVVDGGARSWSSEEWSGERAKAGGA